MLIREGLRAELGGVRRDQWRRLLAQCDVYRGQTPPAEHPTASITYLGPAAANLALAYRLSGQRGYLDEAWRWISAAISFPHWGKANLPDHDLDAGWLLQGLGLAYDWLGDALAPDQRRALHDKLALQGERLFDYAVKTEGTWWSSAHWQNHNWICYAGLATAGYALDRPLWTDQARANFDSVVDVLPADGSDAEGVAYWRYGVPWIAYYLDLLRDAEGIDWFDLCAFLRNTFHYRLHQSTPGLGEHVDHGDCHNRRTGHSVALYYKVAGEYGIGEAQWLADIVDSRLRWQEVHADGIRPGLPAEAFLELLWYEPSIVGTPPTSTTAYFPDLGLVAARTGWDEDASMVSVKAAPGGGHAAWEAAHKQGAVLSAGHHHPDAGSFVFASQGAFLAIDVGYSREKRAAQHNLLLVDDQGFAGEGGYDVYRGAPYERRAWMRDVLISDGWVQATAVIGAMYDPALGVRRLERTFVFTPKGRLVIRDECVAEVGREWTFLLQADWPIAVNDRTAVLQSGLAQAWVSLLSPADARVSTGITSLEANPTASTPSLMIKKRMHTLRVSTDRCAAATFLTAIEAVGALAPGHPTATQLGDGMGVAFDDETVLFGPYDGQCPPATYSVVTS